MNVTTTPAQRRSDFVRSLTADVNGELGTARACNIIYRVQTEGPALGRTARWKDAIAWINEQDDAGMDPAWIALQGSVFLAHAAE
jgi:hypothetical protein